MPTFSINSGFPFLRFHRRSRSLSPNTSPAGPNDDDAVPAHSLGFNPPLPTSARPLSGLRVGPEPAVNTQATGTSRPSAPWYPVNYQDSAKHLDDGPPGDSGGRLELPPRTQSCIVPSNTAEPCSSSVYIAAPRTTGVLAPLSSQTNSTTAHGHPVAPLPVPQSHATFSRRPPNSQHPTSPRDQSLSQVQSENHVMFSDAHDFTANESIFVAGNVGSVNVNTSNQFMKELLENTIPGAQFDSSDRDPPPRCHPGTRLDILERCLSFIHNCEGQRKIRWVVGAAGVGKSAIMQSVAESPELQVNGHASVFFSVDGRNDGTKTIITISYQFATKFKLYRELIEEEITHDPSLLRSSMAKQFLRLIVDPFIHNPELNPAGRVLVIIDGLDECRNPRTQVELLRLIFDFCIKYSSSPLVWLIASRPETHLTSFFASAEVKPAYEKEEIAVDSNEARADMERFLRHELMKIKTQASDSLGPQWPEERHIWKLANASCGLFAYAQTAIRYIGDSTIGSPASQFSDVLNVIDNHPMTGITPEEHPMALLDALYARILSKVPPRIMINTRKLLLSLASNWNWDPYVKGKFSVLCNWLGMTPDEAYAALNHLRSVLYVPRRNEAHRGKLEALHKSFTDYIRDFARCGFSRDIEHEVRQLINECTFRILKEASDGIDFGDADYDMLDGRLALGPGTGDHISLSWPVDEGVEWNDNETRLRVYKLAIREVVSGMAQIDPTFQNTFCIHILTTRFQSYNFSFPRDQLRDFVFDESRRDEFTKQSILKFIPLKTVDISRIIYKIKLQVHRSATIETHLSNPCNSPCEHEWEGVGGEEQKWTTLFRYWQCPFCCGQLQLQLESLRTRSPNRSVPILFTSAGECCVELRFVDTEDGKSEWIYWFWIKLTSEELKEFGSTV